LNRIIDVSFSEFIRYLVIALAGNLFSCDYGFLNFWQFLQDSCADGRYCGFSKWTKFIFFNLHQSHEIVPLDGDIKGAQFSIITLQLLFSSIVTTASIPEIEGVAGQ